jgi:hypothetical protein
VPFLGWGDRPVAGPDGLHGFAALLDETDSFGHVEDLAAGVLLPGGVCSGWEVRAEYGAPVVVKIAERIHPHLAGEVLGVSVAGLMGSVDVHGHAPVYVSG